MESLLQFVPLILMITIIWLAIAGHDMECNTYKPYVAVQVFLN